MSGLIQVLVACFVVLLMIGVPISIALVLAAAAAMAFAAAGGLDLTQIPLQLYESTSSFPLLAVPFFVLAGSIMSRGGMSDRLIDLARSFVGRIPGGVAMVSVVACMFFAAVSGSTAATTAAIGIVLIPAMIESGFSRGAATGLQATAGSIGIIIPPSIPFVLLGVIGSISIGKLFLGGVLPGIAIGAALMAVSFAIARVQKHPPSSSRTSLANILRAAGRSILPLLTVVFVIGGIMLGMVTPTEAAIVAVVWSLIVSVLIYRELTAKDFYESLVDTVKVTGIVVLCIGATAPFAWLLTVEQVPQNIADSMTAMTANPALLTLMMLAILLAIGTFIDLTPAMILLVPILMPIAKGIGMDPVHFGVMLILALGIGQSTPPVGISLFVACSVGKAKMSQVALPLLPFLAAMIVVLIAVAFWPPLTTWLPNLLMCL
ncbi:MAG: TRAP transporter large permease [Pirellulaceae bacterium]|nr:TRAP transporter large permease [Pirellulaceae bacterium]